MFNQGMAVMETRAHLEVLVSRDQAASHPEPGGPVLFRAVDSTCSTHVQAVP